MTAESPTVLLDMTTGQRVAHFAEVDLAAERTPDSQALLLRPAARLAGGHRYAVAITNRVRAKNGDDLAVPPGFAALRDGKHTDHELLEAMRPRFAEVLEALDAAGIPEDDLVVAWDFTVASDAHLFADTATARDRAVAALDGAPDHVHDQDRRAGRRRQRDPPPDHRHARRAAPPHQQRRRGPRHAARARRRRPARGAAASTRSRSPRSSRRARPRWAGRRSPWCSTATACWAAPARRPAACSAPPPPSCAWSSSAPTCAACPTMDLPAVARALNELSFADEMFEVQTQGIVNHVALVRAMRTTLRRGAVRRGRAQARRSGARLLLRAVAGRDLRHRRDGVRADDHARRARCRRRELLDAARSLRRLADLPDDPERRVPRSRST